MNSVPRFWNKVDTSGDCWLWLAGRNPSGYGQFTMNVNGSTKRKIVQAHRVAYELTYGSIPEGLIVCHRCNNRQCVNPAHLYAGTPQDNANDRVTSGKPRKERKPMTETIYTQEPGKYHVQKTVGGWVVVFISDRNTVRNVDGGKVHESRQNAYAKAQRLNETIGDGASHWFFAEQKDGTCGQYILAEHKADAREQAFNTYGLPRKSWKIRQCDPDESVPEYS